jgi:excisionase family DNA binding protein
MVATRITGPFNPRLLRTKDAASYLGMSPGQIRRLVQDGVLPVIKNGTGEHAPFLLDVRDLDSYVERAKVVL